MPAARSASKGRRSATPKRSASKSTKRAPTPSKTKAAPEKAASPKRSSSPAKSVPPPKTPSVAPSQARAPSKSVAPAGKLFVGKIDKQANDLRRQFTPQRDVWDGHYEFGGTLGAIGMIIFSHFIMYYLWACIEFYQGQVVYPGHPLVVGETFESIVAKIASKAAPTLTTFAIFSGFQVLQFSLAVILPGPVTYGLPIPSENGYHLPYRCNAVYAWYIILAVLAGVHYYGIYPLHLVRASFGHFMTAAVIWGDAVSVVIYLSGFVKGNKFRMTGSHIYDFFMGSVLNPRLLGVDLKLWAEIRNSWVLLFILTLSCAAEQYRQTGAISLNMAFMILAHFLYVNACQKGEECICTTWDIYYEKFGWMLIFWNFAGVPFVYCFQSLFIQTVKVPPFSTPVMGAMFAALIFCYYVWDTVNSQKNRFRMKRQGVDEAIIRRKTFPQLPWGYIENPRTLVSDDGKLELFADGWYRIGRKIHYTADMSMSLMWGLSCGISHFIPFFYFCFFFSHLTHRQVRDDERCHKKYGKLWEAYTALVPYKFIPYVY